MQVPFNKNDGWLTQPLKNPEKHLTAKNVKYFDKDGFELTPAEVAILKENGIQVPKYKDCTLYQKSVHWNMEDYIRPHLPPQISIDHTTAFVRYGFAGDLRDQIQERVDNLYSMDVAKLLTIIPKWGIDIALDFVDVDVHEQTYEVFEVLHIEHDFETCEELNAMDEIIADKIISLSHNKWAQIIDAARQLNSLELDIGAMRDAKAKLFGFQYGERPRKIY